MAERKNTKGEVISVIDSMVGTLSDDIILKEANTKSPEEIENELYRKLKRYEKDGEILWGTIYGIEEFEGHAVFCILWNNIKVSIPDESYFEADYDFGKNYQKLSDTEKLKFRVREAKFKIGALIPFKVILAQRELISKGAYEGEYAITVIGSRRDAMETLRDIWFWHKNRKRTDKTTREVHEGDIVKAHILAVKESSVEIEVLGCETRLVTHNLLDNEIVTNCEDHVSVGDTIPVRIKKVYLNDDGTIHLSATGRLNEVSKLISSMKTGSNYQGQVEKYNAEKRTYTIILINGVLAAVPEASVMGRVELNRGDVVQVYVVNKHDAFVSGSCMLVKRNSR